MNIISNCHLCNERSLHLMGEGENQVQQCINCGYVSSEKFKLKDKEKKKSIKEKILPKKKKDRLEELRKELD